MGQLLQLNRFVRKHKAIISIGLCTPMFENTSIIKHNFLFDNAL